MFKVTFLDKNTGNRPNLLEFKWLKVANEKLLQKFDNLLEKA